MPTIKHSHSDYEITTIAEGSGKNVINGKAYDMDFGTFMILGPKHVHQQISDKPILRRDLCISCELMKKICDELDDNLFAKISSSKPIIIRLLPSECSNILSRLENAENPVLSAGGNDKAILHSIVSYFLGIFIEQSASLSENQPAAFTDFLKKIYKPEVFCKPVSEIIPLSNYSHSRFLVLFKKYSGKTLIDYLTDLRMDYAAKLLIQTDLSIITIAGETGYDNQSFFTKKFKERYGVTPKTFRKNRLIGS